MQEKKGTQEKIFGGSASISLIIPSLILVKVTVMLFSVGRRFVFLWFHFLAIPLSNLVIATLGTGN